MVCDTWFFFSSRRRHTRSKRDWSSDVCSSDLARAEQAGKIAHRAVLQVAPGAGEEQQPRGVALRQRRLGEIGRASCRERVEISGVAVALKKKRENEKGCTGGTQRGKIQKTGEN